MISTVLPPNPKLPPAASNSPGSHTVAWPTERELPLFPLDLVLLPGELLPLHIFEPRYRSMVSRSHEYGREFGVVRQSQERLEQAGCTAKVQEVTRRFDDGRFNVMVIGVRRFRVQSFDTSEECLHAVAEFFEDRTPAQADAAKVGVMLDAAERVSRFSGGRKGSWEPNHPWLSLRIAADLPVEPGIKQTLLETRSEVERVERLTGYLQGVLRKRDQKRGRERVAQGNGRLRS